MTRVPRLFVATFMAMLVTMTGYCMIGISLALLHAFASLLRFRRSARALGLCYVVVKVALLLVAENSIQHQP